MQVGGIGSGLDPHSHTHTVSHCIHGDDAVEKKSGGTFSFKAAQALEAQVNSRTSDGSFSFFEWAGELFKGAKKLIGRIWGGDTEDPGAEKGTAVSGVNTSKSQIAALPDREAERQMAELAAQSLIPGKPRLPGDQSAFSSPGSAGSAHTLLQKLRYKARALTNAFARRFAFTGRQDFNAGTGGQQEEMQRRRSYTQNGAEIDSVQPPDSYLMDSYDKTGAYSRISTKR